MKRILSYLLVTALLVTCLLTGLVLPVTAQAAQATDPNNLLANGDFEQGATGWDNCADMVKEGAGYGGSTGLVYDRHGYGFYATYSEAQPFDLDPYSTYRITYRCHGTPTCIYRTGTYSDISTFGRTIGTVDYDGR